MNSRHTVKTRDYDEKLYAAVGWLDDAAAKKKQAKDVKALFG